MMRLPPFAYLAPTTIESAVAAKAGGIFENAEVTYRGVGIGQVSTMVDENPDAAAQLLKRWLNRG